MHPVAHSATRASQSKVLTVQHTSMDPQLSDSDSDDFDEDLLKQDHLNLIRALGNPLQKVSLSETNFTKG